MGVRKFFPSLVTKYKNIKFVFSKKDVILQHSIELVDKFPKTNNYINNVDELYIDTNCLAHPMCFKVYGENKSLYITNPERLEQLMILEIIKYIETLINLTNPQCLVYIAIDGVAPRAKRDQQRDRRFKAIEDMKMRENVAKKYDVEYHKPWNNSAITPGTKFMSKLTNAILNYINEKQINNRENSKKIKYVFSSANTSGEGEHKILQEIRKVKNEDKVRIIYGLDADLLYLSMASEAEKLFLLREVSEFQNIQSDDGFCYVNIDLMKDCIFNDMTEDLIMESVAEITEFKNLSDYKNNFIRDYVFFGFMIGNDFLPHLPSVHLDYNKEYSGLNILISSYKEVFGQINDGKDFDYQFIINKKNNKITMSYEFVKSLFHELYSREEEFFKNTYKLKRYYNNRTFDYTSFEDEMFKRENMQFHVPNIFQLGANNTSYDESKKRFYEYYELTDCIEETCEKYIEGLLWNGYYYFDKCTDYLWAFGKKKTPFVADIYLWILRNEEKFSSINNKYPKIFTNEMKVSPLEQLYMVLPVQSSYLLPSGAKKFMLKDKEHFPLSVRLDYQGICKLWQASPRIENVDHHEAKRVISQLLLTDEEKDRNKHKKIYQTLV